MFVPSCFSSPSSRGLFVKVYGGHDSFRVLGCRAKCGGNGRRHAEGLLLLRCVFGQGERTQNVFQQKVVHTLVAGSDRASEERVVCHEWTSCLRSVRRTGVDGEQLRHILVVLETLKSKFAWQ